MNMNMNMNWSDSIVIWFPISLTNDIPILYLRIIMSSYQRCSAPVSTHVLEVLLWIWCNPHLDSFMYSSDWKAYEQFLKGMMMIAEQQQGLNEVENVHVFCQLLNRIMVGKVWFDDLMDFFVVCTLLSSHLVLLLDRYLGCVWLHTLLHLHQITCSFIARRSPAFVDLCPRRSFH